VTSAGFGKDTLRNFMGICILLLEFGCDYARPYSFSGAFTSERPAQIAETYMKEATRLPKTRS
jgi:hypothetical protein